eukprot:gene22135-29197_t
MPLEKSSSNAGSANGSQSSFNSSKSFFSKIEKYELERKFYEKVDDFDHKVLLHREPGMVMYRARCSYSGAIVGLKGYSRDALTMETRKQNNSCPFILKCFDAFEDQGWRWLVLENCALGDLYGVTKDVGSVASEGWMVTQVLLPLLQTVTYLHNEGIIHRDIKPENLYFNSERVAKLSGFFLSVDVTRYGLPADMVGSLDYVSPEVFKIAQGAQSGKGFQSRHYDYKVDVWQIGVLTFDVLSGQPPFASVDAESTAHNILTQEPDWLPWMSNECIDFIERCLTKDPWERPTAKELLAHPWIRFNMGWKPPEDFEDPLPSFDPDTYLDAEEDNEVFIVKKWYNPMTWFTKSDETDDLRGEQDLQGTTATKSFFGRLFDKQDKEADHDPMEFMNKEQISKARVSARGSREPGAALQADTSRLSARPGLQPEGRNLGVGRPGQYGGAGALPSVGGTEMHKYKGGMPNKGGLRRDDFIKLESYVDNENENNKEDSHIIKVEAKPPVSRDSKTPVQPLVPLLDLCSAKNTPLGSGADFSEQSTRSEDPDQEMLKQPQHLPAPPSRVMAEGVKTPSQLEADDQEDCSPRAQTAPDKPGLGMVLDQMRSGAPEADPQGSRISPANSQPSPPPPAFRPQPPPLPLSQMNSSGSADGLGSVGKPGIGSFRAGKDSPFSSPRRPEPTPPGGETPRSARSHLSSQGVQEPPIPGSSTPRGGQV